MAKVKVTMKTPDAIEDGLRSLDLNTDEREEAIDKLGKWFKYGEYLDVLFDLEEMTAEVCRTD